MVDTYCDRRFFTNGTAEVRTYAAVNGTYLSVDDVATLATVKTSTNVDGTFDTTWATTDYQTEPLNRWASGVAFPITRLRAIGDYSFPVSQQAAVQITGTFGFGTAVPTQVTHATIILSLRQLKRYESPTGVQGGGDYGPVYISRKTDPDVAAILDPLRRNVVAVG